MVDTQGRFSLKGVADKTHSFHKVVIEGYRFDERTGQPSGPSTRSSPARTPTA